MGKTSLGPLACAGAIVLAASLPGGCIGDLGVEPGAGGMAAAGGSGGAAVTISSTGEGAGSGSNSTTTSGEGGSSPEQLWAEGEEIFQKTAGGKGCAYCHGPDGLSGPEYEGPKIAGKSKSTIANALKTIAEMQFIKLTPHQIDAVAVYVKWLGEQ